MTRPNRLWEKHVTHVDEDNLSVDARSFWEDLMKTSKYPLCSELLNEPKKLPRLRSFCLTCLNKLAHSERRRFNKSRNQLPNLPVIFPVLQVSTFTELSTSCMHSDSALYAPRWLSVISHSTRRVTRARGMVNCPPVCGERTKSSQ